MSDVSSIRHSLAGHDHGHQESPFFEDGEKEMHLQDQVWKGEMHATGASLLDIVRLS